jgi:type I restriction enzyme R subunit
MAFYDALSEGKGALKDGKLKDLVKEIVSSVRRDLQIDWTSQEVTKARIRTDIRLILLQHDYAFDEIDKITKRIFEQAFSLYGNYDSEAFESAQIEIN